MIISTDSLFKEIDNEEYVIIDASWYLPNDKRDTFSEYKLCHIPGAFFFDIDNVCNKKTDLPHMLPSKKQFKDEISMFGINENSKIVIYDSKGVYSSPRLWWMFNFFGISNVFILDGGLPKWLHENKPITKNIPSPLKGKIKVQENWSILANMEKVILSIKNKDSIILDARTKERFLGKADEPRENLRKGNINCSINLFFEDLLIDNKTFRNKNQIKQIFKLKKVDFSKHIIVSCGSGITAAILFFSLKLIGVKNVSLYDGSWSEWGSFSIDEIEKLLHA